MLMSKAVFEFILYMDRSKHRTLLFTICITNKKKINWKSTTPLYNYVTLEPPILSGATLEGFLPLSHLELTELDTLPIVWGRKSRAKTPGIRLLVLNAVINVYKGRWSVHEQPSSLRRS